MDYWKKLDHHKIKYVQSPIIVDVHELISYLSLPGILLATHQDQNHDKASNQSIIGFKHVPTKHGPPCNPACNDLTFKSGLNHLKQLFFRVKILTIHWV